MTELSWLMRRASDRNVCFLCGEKAGVWNICRAAFHWHTVFGSMRLWATRQHIPKRERAQESTCAKQQPPLPLQARSPSTELLSIGILSSTRSACGQQDKTYLSERGHKRVHVKSNSHFSSTKPFSIGRASSARCACGHKTRFSKAEEDERGQIKAHVS